ncbi:MAG TPA: xanthine dehydrogenase family protein molybdopterin-binding subunit [Burkholderiales bacterium]
MRREDDRLLTGRGRFTSDWNFPDQLYAAVLRSPHAHADLVSVDAAAALAMPGVRAVLLAADFAAEGWGTIQGGVPFEGTDGKPMRKPDYPVLAEGRVRFVGEPVAFVVADTPARAQDAAEAVGVTYRERDPVSQADAALAAGAPLVHDAIPGNLAMEFARGDAAAVEAALARAHHRSRLTLRSQRLVSNPIEPRACVVRHEPGEDRYVICTPSQGIGNLRARVAPVAGVPGERLHFVAEDVGGSFGTRSTPYPELFCCMLAAKRLGRPVKWTGPRTDSFLSDFHGRALTLSGEIGLDAEGRILALRWDDVADLGAYASAWGAFVGSNNLAVTMGGVYRVPALAMRSRLVYTNTMPVSAYRGAGRPDIAFAIERLIEHACAEHGLDPIATRRRNFITPAEMPYTTANGTVYDCGHFEAVLDHGLKAADWAGFAARRAASAAAGRLRGIGLASYLEASGGGAAPQDQVLVRFDAEGVPTLYCVAQASGQGHETTFVNLFARESGFPAARVRYRASDPDAKIVGNGTGGSRTALGQGSAFKLLAAALVEKARPHAAEALGAHEHELRFSAGTFSANGMTVTLERLAARLAGAGSHPLDCDAGGKFGVTYPNGCHVAEVEIDPETGETRLARYTAVDDIGTLLEPVLVEGQVHGGVMQGAGQVLCEQAVYDETGQLLTASFMDYAMPRADDLPEGFAVQAHPVPTGTNPLGAKGVGESGCSGAMPAVMNAVLDALRARGVQDLDMPATPERVWRALQAR